MRDVSASIPTTEPARIVAGDTAKWAKSLADYPAGDGWTLSYSLVTATNRYTFSASADGDDHLVTVAAATTAVWVPDPYAWRAQVALSGEVYTVGEGIVTVAAAFGAAVDARSLARRQLDAVEAMLEGRASSSVAEYSIAGRALKYIPVTDLMVLRDRLRMDVAREDAATASAAGLPVRGRVFVRFGA